MSNEQTCEYCGRPIKKGSVTRVLRGEKHVFCTEFCYRLFFYKIPGITFEAVNKMYEAHCASVKVPDFSQWKKEEE